MKIQTTEQGFSILEMLLAMSITIGLTGTIFYFIQKGQVTYTVEGARSDMQQNFRAAVDLISRDIQAAGAGIPKFLGPILTKDGGGTTPDRILFLYGNPDFSQATVAGPVASSTAQITAMDTSTATPSSYVVGKTYLLYNQAKVQSPLPTDVTDFAEFSVFSIAASGDIVSVTGGKKITPTVSGTLSTYLSGSTWSHTMSFPSGSDLAVVELQEMVEYQIDSVNKTLQRNQNQTGWVDVARGITDLQFAYGIETVDNSTTPATFPESVVDNVVQSASNNRALIRRVRVTLTGQTQMATDPDHLGQRAVSLYVTVAPRNLVLPGFVPNR